MRRMLKDAGPIAERPHSPQRAFEPFLSCTQAALKERPTEEARELPTSPGLTKGQHNPCC
jgi:hypothetical protein